MKASLESKKNFSLWLRLLLILSLTLACVVTPAPTITPQPPTLTPEPPNHAPLAANSELYVQQGTSSSLDLKSLASDPDAKDQLVFSVESAPQHGGATISASTLTFTPVADYLGTDQLTYQVSDGRGGIAQASISITISIAPPLAENEITNFSDATDFLYTGDNPIQTGVEPGTIEEKRVAVLRGLVADRDNKPLAGAKITVLGHPEYGETLTRDDGAFDIAVNGGGWITLNYEKEGYILVQRQVEAPWVDYAQLPDVVLLNEDENVTPIDLSATTPMQVARGSEITDDDGTRRATLFFPQGTSARLAFPDGTTQPLTQLRVRITEYTVGPDGEKAMPGDLPPSSAYTYATEFSAEEATETGASTVWFDPAIISYNENFLNFPVGMTIPMGAYDREKGVWIPSDNGLVIKILNITSGKAELDVTGSEQPATSTELASLGITDAELSKLAELYTAGQSLWRTPVPHFSPWDCNWPYAAPENATAPNQPKPNVEGMSLEDPDQVCGSIINCQEQSLGESVEVAGTPYQLHYQSDRTQDYKAPNRLRIQLSGDSIPASLENIHLNIHIAGRSFYQTFPAATNQNYTFEWDGKDGYGRRVRGMQPVLVRVGYSYQAVYSTPAEVYRSFDAFGSGVVVVGGFTRNEFIVWQDWKELLGSLQNEPTGLGGWDLDIHHAYDPNGAILYFGDGSQRNAESMNIDVINTVAGNNVERPGYGGDGGPATQAALYSPFGVAVGPDGSIYIADTYNNRVRRVNADGIISTVAGNGTQGDGGDGGSATQAMLYWPWGLAVGPDGSLYIADSKNNRVRRVGPDGVITTVAGNGIQSFSGDGGLATQAALALPYAIALGPGGSLYIADSGNNRIRRVGTDGIISTVAGDGNAEYRGDGDLATKTSISGPQGVAVDSDGNLFISDSGNARIRRVGPDGIITTVAGIDRHRYSGDGGFANQAALWAPNAVAVGPDGSLYISDSGNLRIRRVSTEGIITTVAGNGRPFNSDDGGLATQSTIYSVTGVAIGPDGSLYLNEANYNRIRRVAPAFSGITFGTILLTSEDGSELYNFNAIGQHVRTLNALTGALLYEFTYDDDGRLWKVEDGDGNITEMKRDSYGNLKQIIAPFGQTTNVTLDGNGYLKTITNSASETVQFKYTDGGLMTSLTDARGFVHKFDYDDETGKLTRDEDPASGYTALSRVDDAQGYTVRLETALGHITTYRVDLLPTGSLRRVNTYPDGTQSEYIQNPDGTRSWRYSDGTSKNVTLSPDPRWGMAAPVISQFTITTPQGLTYSAQESRSATLTDPNDPFSLVRLTDTVLVNGHTYTSTYTAATRTWVLQSPEGRTLTAQTDDLGRIVFEQVTGLAPVNYVYDTYGRLEKATLGTGTDARMATFTYNTSGLLESVTDPLLRKVTFEYDLAGRVTKQTLPDQRVITYTYDLSSNLKTLTPPGKPAHTFDYTPVDLPSEYAPPDVNAGEDKTLYDYNADRQLEKLTRPDGQMVTVGYDGAGRLDTLTIARGS